MKHMRLRMHEYVAPHQLDGALGDEAMSCSLLAISSCLLLLHDGGAPVIETSRTLDKISLLVALRVVAVLLSSALREA
jgi:hypothetical protein